MREVGYALAIRDALREEMLRDENVFILGEEIGSYGGAFGCTKGMLQEFGPERVRDTPISETAIIGVAIGAAILGMRPIAEIQFADFFGVCMDQVFNQAAKIRFMSGGKIKLPLVIRTQQGAGFRIGAQHSQSVEAWFMHVPGLKIAIPSTPYDAKGLLKSAIRDNNPTLFFEHKFLYATKGPIPEEEYTLPFGKAEVKRIGDDVTILATSYMVHKTLAAAEDLSKQGIEVEVIDLRTLAPLDIEAVVNSVKKTGRVVTVEEGCKTCGVGAELAAMIFEHAFDYLDASIQRVAALDAPIGYSPPLEDFVIPDKNKIIKAVKDVVSK